VLGSAEVLGNPIGLMSNVVMGLRDLVVEPVRGLFTSPSAFLNGLLFKGPLSAARHVIFGMSVQICSNAAHVYLFRSNTMMKISGSVTKGHQSINVVCEDPKFLIRAVINGCVRRYPIFV
jgi:hypothetical protein